MYSQIIISSFAVAAVVLAQGNFTVNTATVAPATCQPYAITWVGGVAPFFPTVTVAGQPNSVLKRFEQTNSQSVLWTVDQPAGTTVTFAVRDSTGVNQPSGISAPIVDGGSTSCFTSSTAVGGAGGSESQTSSSAAGASTPASSSSAPATSAPATTSSSRPSTSAPASSSTRPPATTSAAPNAAVSYRGTPAVIAAVVGVAVAALV